ncbi:MAG: TonB-dependent receptor [Tannerella sp.]|jgi:hypothetical protein|nr:TonB-dependent receptor [Tannerella sp.]
MWTVILLIAAGCLLLSGANAQSLTLSGTVTDAETKEVLIGAGITCNGSPIGAFTNSYGFYSLKIPKGSVKLSCSYTGYDPVEFDLAADKDTTVNIRLLSGTIEIPEIVINVNRNGRLNRGLGTIHVPVAKIKRTPAFFGESDLMKSLQYIPGIKNSSEGKSDLTIRGGSPDENLVLLDGIPVYNASHAFGFLSIFNSDAIKNVTLFKSGFPARFGGRLSSVIDINTKDGNKEAVRGSATLGLLAANFNVEGPIVRDKTSFFVSARRSVIDLYLVGLQNYLSSDGSENGKTNFNFYDLNAKVHHKIGDKTSVYLMAYNGRDRLMNKTGSIVYDGEETSNTGEVSNSLSEQDWEWGNTLCAIRLNNSVAPNMFLNATLTYNSYRYRTTVGESYILDDRKIMDALDYSSGIRDFSASIEYEYAPSNNHFLRSGLQVVRHDFRPEVLKSRSDSSESTVPSGLLFRDIRGTEYSFYAEDEWNMTQDMRMNVGIRLSSSGVDGISYNAFDPRLSLRYLLTKNLSVTAEYTRMKQYIHLLTNNSLLLQTDLWVPSSGSVKPMQSDQFSLGFNALVALQMTFSVSGYYKSMGNVLEYKDGASFANTSSGWESKVESGIGRAYGVEFALEKDFGRSTGTIAYTLSKTERKFDGINYGEWFPAKYDRRHLINAAIMHTLSPKLDVMLNWGYSSGNMMTIPVMTAVTPDIPYYPSRLDDLTQLEHRNNYRMPAFHRLDIGVNYAPRKSEKRYGIWNFSIYNIYNRMNAFKIYVETDVSRNSAGEVVYTKKLRQVSIFPFMPSVSYTYKF